ncbi:ATP-NAD kinase family protein [Aestuariibacter halophilus]|uniref:ATP-NAD kinase family protein n=1 Tax=Fluctibacter halophilus TaxID=226011 RepID=A0ABS8G8B3_9ALTE|nr:ATP-NAD kinase family protein [Aestuariibacter halophilus]MCC2616753.1 ATP-NAD kinase family protein [Aestuariibacter halophilus]
MRRFKLGLVVNPYSGIGGAMALKGSDGPDIRAQALAMGAQQLANPKTAQALAQLDALADRVEVFTAAADMGEQVARQAGLPCQVVYQPVQHQTEGEDTEAALRAILEHQPDMILFAGGDGTARLVFDVVGEQATVLGVPTGCKIHSGVFAVSPAAAGRVLSQVVGGQLVSVQRAEVRDIDETLFREGKVQARYYGELWVPLELRYMQSVKSGGKESDELVLDDIADYVAADIEEDDDCLFVIGSGSTTAHIMQRLGCDNTLLGVDIVQHGQLLDSDVTEQALFSLVSQQRSKLVITLIGGQGHILGRGNQQLSPRVVDAIGRDNIVLVATKTKLNALNGRPLLVDSGDPEFDQRMSGPIRIVCGYQDHVLYPVAGLED